MTNTMVGKFVDEEYFEVRRNLFIAWILYKETLMDFLVNILD